MNTSSKLKILSWNAQGIRNKKNGFFQFMLDNNIDIACVQETKLNHDLRFNHPAFRIFRLDNEQGNISCGGVAIVISQSLECDLLPPIETNLIQCIGVNITIVGSGNIRIMCAYLTGTTTNHDYKVYREDLYKISQIGQVIVLGDLNSRHKHWNCTSNNQAGIVLYDFMNDNIFEVLYPSEPTHIPNDSSASPSVLDLVLSNSDISLDPPSVVNCLGSDHLPIFLEINIDVDKTEKLVQCFKKTNWNSF